MILIVYGRSRETFVIEGRGVSLSAAPSHWYIARVGAAPPYGVWNLDWNYGEEPSRSGPRKEMLQAAIASVLARRFAGIT